MSITSTFAPSRSMRDSVPAAPSVKNTALPAATTRRSVLLEFVALCHLPRVVPPAAQALGGAEVVISTGGTGPTADDLTSEVLAGVLGVPLVEASGP